MRQLGIRILKRSIVVGLILAAIGYILAEVLLIFAKMNNASFDVTDDTFRWGAALRCAAAGIVLLVVCELIAFAVRRNRAQPAASPVPEAFPPATP